MPIRKKTNAHIHTHTHEDSVESQVGQSAAGGGLDIKKEPVQALTHSPGPSPCRRRCPRVRLSFTFVFPRFAGCWSTSSRSPAHRAWYTPPNTLTCRRRLHRHRRRCRRLPVEIESTKSRQGESQQACVNVCVHALMQDFCGSVGRNIIELINAYIATDRYFSSFFRRG